MTYSKLSIRRPIHGRLFVALAFKEGQLMQTTTFWWVGDNPPTLEDVESLERDYPAPQERAGWWTEIVGLPFGGFQTLVHTHDAKSFLMTEAPDAVIVGMGMDDLRDQKSWLVQQSGEEPVEGLLNLLDHLQDASTDILGRKMPPLKV